MSETFLYLASRSPRRQELLSQMGIPFELIHFRQPPRADEALNETPLAQETPLTYVERVARAKAEHGARIVHWRKFPLRLVLAADTCIEFNGEIIGKPAHAQDAIVILQRLAGHTHRVLSAVAIAHAGRIESVLCVSEVSFCALGAGQIADYVSTGEPLDKAGAYGIQGRAAAFVEHLAGSYSGVMGLPIFETNELLRRFGFMR